MDKLRSLVHGLFWILLFNGIIYCNQILDEDFQTLCSQRCPFQNKTEEHFDVGCGSDCKIGQCSRGCQLWRKALESSCQTVCNGTQSMLTQKELHCVMGCNDAINQYFQKLKEEIGIPPAPYLVADTLTATSLSLAWEGARYSDISYLVQWRYEEHAGAWQYCRNQSWGPSSVVLVENLQPYTKYRFRVALLLSPHSEPIVSEPSVVISTLAAGIPSSPPIIIRATAVDSKRISVSWKPGPFPNGPIHSYVLELVGEYTSLKEDIPVTKNTDFYMFQNLNANSKYVISISMRNAVGEGPTATAEISTPPEPSVKDTLQPILILGSKHRVIRQGADMMLDVPVPIYESSDLITGIGIHVNKSLLFVSDAAGYVSVTSLREYSEPKYVLTPADTSFKPLDLSVDWLNQHLYILGEVSHNKGTLWQVARCSLDGRGLTVAVAGITSKPLHIEVDPYNGYLFWLIQGHNRGGLYRLDLANISNGIKHEVVPDVILEDPHLGAFIVDHTNFCILIPNHAKNTVFSVSLDGREVVDLRSNTQQPKFQNVLSLAIANGLFYWTDGDEVLAEDYHEEYHTYFHNHYLGSKNRSYISVSIDLPTSQPVPVPVNPPIHVQAVLGGHVAKTTWQTPHLVGGQGKGAWQNWSYELQIKNEKSGEVRTRRDINNSTFYTIEDLEDDTEYVIKAAAYTSSGSGPWSSEFRGKTLKTPPNGKYPVILWSAAEGLLESDVTGEQVETLISQENLKDSKGDYHFVDLSWYQDSLYLVTNTTRVHRYNLTSHEYERLHNLDSVGSIAIDWIGKKLYWSNPKQQLIIRGDLMGSGQEPLPILTIAKELNIDSQHAFIYWSTGHAVECARLNGDARRVYYPAELFSGKQVMGLTLNTDDRHVYWIIRSNEGSNLYKAPMADSNGVTTEEIEPIKVSSLQHPNMQGPLCYFSDHLLWLQDNKNAVIGDMTGQNAAVISGTSLSGLNMVAVMDNNLYSDLDKNINVIPEQIDEDSIRVIGSSSSFNITWSPVTNVNAGQVFYELTTEDYIKPDPIVMTDNVLVYERAELLRPYSEIRITLQAFTYWGSSPRVKKILHSPPSPPSVPVNVRVFVNSHRNASTGGANIIAVLRWNLPKEPNGPITAYRVNWGYKSGDIEKSLFIVLDPDKSEYSFENLMENTIYYFQIQAFTLGGEGKFSKPIYANTSIETPVPTLLVAARDSISIIDCDSHMYKTLSTGDRPTDAAINIHERKVYWLNEMQEIVSIDLEGMGKSKIHTMNGTGLSLAVDWVGRYLYWSELEERDPTSMTSSIYRLDISQWESGFLHIHKVIRRSRRIQEIEICPFTNMLYWIEVNRHGAGHLMKSPADGSSLRPLFSIHDLDESRRQCNCPENPRIGKTLSLDQTNPYDPVVLYSDEWQGRLYQTGSRGCDCKIVAYSQKLPPMSVTSDHRYVYWSNETENSVYILKQDSKVEDIPVPGVRKITAIGSHLQPFPPVRCLLARSLTSEPILLETTSRSVTLELPKPETLLECENISTPSIQYTIYYGINSEGERMSDELECLDRIEVCNVTVRYRRIVKIEDLKPYSSYVFMVSFKNYYNDLVNIKRFIGPPTVFRTSAGAPSPPRNVTVLPLDPTAVEVFWYPPKELNDQSVSYEIHWKTEGTVAGVRQSGELPVMEQPKDYFVAHKSVTIEKLIPGQLYLIWVRAYSKNSDTFTDSEGIEIETYYQPENITLLQATPYSLEVIWSPPVNLTLGFDIQYCGYSRCQEWSSIPQNGIDRSNRYVIENLSPKTVYRFRVEIFYVRSKLPYVWPRHGGFMFETLGDRPSRPGTPIIQQLRRDVYQVIWEKSKDNGSPIEFYLLEGLVGKIWRSRREAKNYTAINESVNKVDSEEWTVYYNGTDNYWIMNELSPSLKYIFRVRAKNKYGWSDSSKRSKSFDFTQAAMLAEADQQQFGTLFIAILSVLSVGVVVVFIYIICCFRKRRDEKKDLQVLTLATANRGPDVELATLRELPRRGNFIHNANILYAASTDPPTDEEIKLLPHIRRQQFKLTKFLGSGAFGEVYEGIAQELPNSTELDTRVAIKALRKGATEQEKAEFLKEAQLMSHFKHQHILQLLGVCLDNDPNFILMELMEGGDLLSYLRLNRPLINTNNSMTLQDLLSMCVDVAKGCRYLEEMHFVHRDLACRNCLVSSTDPSTRIVKIGDFGLARDIYKNDYYRKEGEGLLPVRWMAPESLVDGVFTSQSDVWAFGVLIWEIMTLGQQPYPARTNLEVLHYVRTGGRLGRPNNCSEELHQLMMKCWSFNPENRPTFKYCLETLENLKEITANAPLTPDVGSNYLEARVARQEYSEDDMESEEFYKDKKQNSDQSWKNERNDETSSAQETLPGEPHRYLELIYGDEVPRSDGYEIPRLPNNVDISLQRTFSVSSNASDGSSLSCPPNVPLVESTTASSNAAYFSSNNTDLSSLEKLLPNGTIPNGIGIKCELENEVTGRLNCQTTENVS